MNTWDRAKKLNKTNAVMLNGFIFGAGTMAMLDNQQNSTTPRRCDNYCPNPAIHKMQYREKIAWVCAPHYYVYHLIGYIKINWKGNANENTLQ